MRQDEKEKLLANIKYLRNRGLTSATSTRAKVIRAVAKYQIATGKTTAESLISDFNSRSDAWMKNLQGVAGTHNSRFSDGENKYRSDSADYLKQVTGSRDNLRDEAGILKDYIEAYRPFLATGSIDGINKMIDGGLSHIDSVVKGAENDNNYWSQWKSEEDYDYYLKDRPFFEALQSGDLEGAEKILNELSEGVSYGPMPDGSVVGRYSQIEQYKNTLDYYKQRKEFMDYDVDAGEKELAELRSEAEKYKLTGWKNIANEAWNSFTLGLNRPGAPFSAQEDQYDRLTAQIEEKEAYHNKMKNGKNSYLLAETALNDSEFERYAAEGENIQNPSNSFEEIKNIATFARDNKIYLRDVLNTSNEGIRGYVDPKYTYMTEQQVKIYSYYLAKDGKEVAQQYLDSIDADLAYKEQEQINIENEKWVTDNPINGLLGSTVSVLTSLGSGLEYAGDAIKYGADWIENPYSAKMDTNELAQQTNAIRGAITDKVDLEIAGWDAFDFLYNTTMSGADSLTAMLIPGGAGAAVLGLSAAAQGTNDALERGMSSEQAFWNGAVQGVFEGLFEKYSIGNFKSLQEATVKSGKDIAKNIAKSMLVNASEEAATEVANILYDTLINGDLSNYQQMLDSGMSPEEVWAQLGAQVLEAAGSGAFMGAGFGGLGSGINAKRTAKAGKGFQADLAERGMSVGDITSDILGLENKKTAFAENTVAYKQAQKIQKKLDSGKKATNYSVGMLISNMSESQALSVVQTRISSSVESETDRARMAQTIVDVAMGKDVSDKALSKVLKNRGTFNALNDMIGGRLSFNKGTTVSEVRAAVKSYQAAAKSQGSGIARTAAKQGAEGKNAGQSNVSFSVSKRNDGKYDVVGEADGESMVFSSYSSEKQAQAAMYALTLEMKPEGTRGFVNVAESLADGVDLGEAAIAFNAVYNQGKSGKALSAVKNMELLSPEQRQYAYQLGIMDRALAQSESEKVSGEVLQNETDGGKIETAQSRRENSDGKADNSGNGRRSSPKHAKKQVEESSNIAFHDEQIVRAESFNADPDVQQAKKENAIASERVVYSSKKAMAYDAVSEDKLSEDQKKAVNIGKDIGVKVVIADTRTANGNAVDGFLGKDGIIYISKNSRSPVAFIFKHELAHFCERSGQKYRDFIKAVRNSAAFKSWLKGKGYNSILDYNSQLRQERASIGQDPGETGANNEIIGNFVGDMMFGDDTTLAERLIGELKPKERRYVKGFLRDFFQWVKGRFTGKGNDARTEIHRLEKMFAKAFRTAVNVDQGSGEQFAYVKKGSYIRKTQYYYGIPFINKNFPPENEVYSEAHRLAVWWARRADIKSGYQTIISMNDRYYLVEKFDDALNYYQVVAGVYAQDVKKIEKEIKEYGRSGKIESVQRGLAIHDQRAGTSAPNKNGGSSVDSSVSGHRYQDRQMVRVASSSRDGGERAGRDGSGNNRSSGDDWQGQDVGDEQFSYTPQNERVEDVFERMRNGELSLEDGEKLLKKPEGDDPVKIANLKKEDMGSTPPLNKKTTGKVGDSDSRFARSVEKSKIFDEKFKEEVNDDNFVKHYASITNKETLAEAANRLDEGGEAYVQEWFDKKAVHMDTVDTMVGFILLKRYQDVGNYRSAVAVAQKVREVGTLSGQRVQAFSIIGRFDADMMQAYAQKELEKAWELAIKGRSQKWIDKHAEQFKLTDEEISFIRDNILYAAELPENSRERAIALAQITTLIQSKIPPAKGQSYKAWQRISMLLNPKTQIRNVAGNLIAAPVFVASDWFSTPLDFFISKVTGVRTTGLTGVHGTKANLKAAGKGLFESCDDFRRHINSKRVTGDRFEIGQGKSFDETRWGRIAKIMNGFDRFTSFLLDAGDRPFYEMWFTNSLNEQMRLNKVSEPTEEMVQIAVDEALARTWQDENRVTKMVSGIKRAANHFKIGGYGVGDVIVKFTKTPANLTKAIYDFSPAAIATLTPQAIKLTKAIKNGTATPSMQKKFVSNFGKMAAGTILYLAFAALYAAGHITGSSDEDKDVAAFEKYIQGIPEYSIKIGDKWFSYDWAQPIGAVPAIIADYMESREEGSSAIASVWEAFKAGGAVLYNQSFMSSIQTLFAAADDPVAGLLDLLLGEITVPIPTVFSQLANVLDDKRRVTYDSTSEFRSAINRAMLKIPGLRNTLEAEIDVLGREVDNSQKNWFNAFFNPANVYTDTSTGVTDHAYEIYQSTGDAGAIPAKAPYSVTLQGKTVKLDDAQRAQYQRAMGETASDLIEILLENDVYKAMSDQEKLSVLKQVYSYSASVAKNQLEWADDFEVISGIAPYITKKNYDAMSDEERYKIVEDYIFSDYEGMEDIESDIGQSNFLINKKTSSLVLEATLAGDMATAIKLINGIDSRVESYGWSESDTAAEVKERKTSVKTTITRYWKAAYLYAYYSDNKDEQEKIQNMLVEIGLYGKKYDVKKTLKEWVENSENDG